MPNDEMGLQYLQNENAALRQSHAWARVALALIAVLAAAGIGWAVHVYFGPPGVRVLLVGVGLIGVVVIIYALSIAVSAVYGRQAMQHHNNVLEGLIAFQRADDYGEVARQVATGMSGAIRSGTNLDATVLRVANQLAQHQQRQLTDGQRAEPPTWSYNEEVDAGATFRRVE